MVHGGMAIWCNLHVWDASIMIYCSQPLLCLPLGARMTDATDFSREAWLPVCSLGHHGHLDNWFWEGAHAVI